MNHVLKVFTKLQDLIISSNTCKLNKIYLELFGLHLYVYVKDYSDDSSIIMIPQNENIIRKEYKAIVKDVLENNGLSNLKINQTKDIISFYNFIIENVSDRIKTKLSYFQKDDMYVKLFMLASYIIEFHQKIRSILFGKLKSTDFQGLNLQESVILNTIDKAQDFLKTDVDGIQGIDKAIIQYLFAMAMTTQCLGSHLYNFNEDDFRDLYILCYTAVNLISERELLTSKLTQDRLISIVNGEIIYNNNWQKAMLQFSKDLLEERTSSPYYDLPQVLHNLKNNFRKVFGFNFDNIQSLINFESILDPDEKSVCYPMLKYELVELISELASCNQDESLNMIDFLTLRPLPKKNFHLNTIDKYEYRLLEYPFLSIRLEDGYDMYLVSVPLLMQSYELNTKKLIYNLIPACQKLNSKLIEDKIKNHLVLNTSEVLQKYTSLILCNAKDFDFKRNNIRYKFSFLNEMDILAILNNSLLLVECKDIHFRFTACGFRQDLNKAVGFINEFKSELKQLYKYLDIIEAFFNTKINKVIPVIVFKTHNISINSFIDRRGIELTSFHLFDDWIQKYVLKQSFIEQKTSSCEINQ